MSSAVRLVSMLAKSAANSSNQRQPSPEVSAQLNTLAISIFLIPITAISLSMTFKGV